MSVRVIAVTPSDVLEMQRHFAQLLKVESSVIVGKKRVISSILTPHDECYDLIPCPRVPATPEEYILSSAEPNESLDRVPTLIVKDFSEDRKHFNDDEIPREVLLQNSPGKKKE